MNYRLKIIFTDGRVETQDADSFDNASHLFTEAIQSIYRSKMLSSQKYMARQVMIIDGENNEVATWESPEQ